MTSEATGARVLRLRDTTIGKKLVMALSGVVLFGFAIVHMLGNLQIFLGPEVINGYHVLLYSMPSLLWTARAVLVLAFAAHVVSAAQLAVQNRRARPLGYAKPPRSDAASAYAARTMLVGGVLLFGYLLHHVLHMTAGVTAGLGYAHDGVDVYANLVQSYRVPWMAGLSIAMTLVFAFHVYHGAWSMLQTLGINHRRYNRGLRRGAVGLGLLVAAGYLSVPCAVLAGWVG